MKIGDVIWYRTLSWEGSSYDCVKILRETSRSWIVIDVEDVDVGWKCANDRYCTKLPKSGKGWAIKCQREAPNTTVTKIPSEGPASEPTKL